MPVTVPIRLSLFLLLTAAALVACSGENVKTTDKPKETPATTVNVAITKGEFLENIIVSTGTILPNEEIELKSEVSGRIVSINFKEGAMVSQGQLLVKIDDSELQAEKKRMDVQLRLIQQDVDRKKQLINIKAISQEDYDIALNKEAELEAEAGLLQSRIAKTNIIAPFSGKVGLRYVSPGAMVVPGDRIAWLVQDNPVRAEFSIPEKYTSLLKENLQVNFSIAGSQQNYAAKVNAIDARIDPATRSMKVRAICPNPGGALRPGAFADIRISLGKEENAILIPSQAIIPELKGQKVFIFRNGKAVSAEVQTGIRQQSLIQITEGLQAGDTVILTGLLQLRDNMPVKAGKIEQTAK